MSTTQQLAGEPLRHGTPHAQWERSAPWVAPLVTAAVFALATFVVFTSCGAALV